MNYFLSFQVLYLVVYSSIRYNSVSWSWWEYCKDRRLRTEL